MSRRHRRPQNSQKTEPPRSGNPRPRPSKEPRNTSPFNLAESLDSARLDAWTPPAQPAASLAAATDSPASPGNGYLDACLALRREKVNQTLAEIGFPRVGQPRTTPSEDLTNASKIVSLVTASAAALFRDPAGRAQITFSVIDTPTTDAADVQAREAANDSAHDSTNDAATDAAPHQKYEKHRETHPLRSRPARNWIARLYHEAFGAVPTSQSMQEALNVLEGRAVHDSAQLDVHLRLAEHAGAIYIDLGDDAWRAVEIDATGWRVIADPPVRFRRPSQLLPLPEPQKTFTAEAAECRGEDKSTEESVANVNDADDKSVEPDLSQSLRTTAPSAVNSISPPVAPAAPLLPCSPDPARSATVPPAPVACSLESAASFSRLRSFLNISNDHWPLVLGWLVAALRPRGPYPVLCLHGEQGSAKSTAALLLRSLVDPNAAPLRGEPKEVRDLMIAATHSHVLCFDNLSRLPDWLSNALCRLSTGGGFSTRTLYENDVETIFSASRPSILVGIDELATRGDLIDRAVVVTLSPIGAARRRPEEDLLAEFELARPAIFGGLCTALSTALANYQTTKLERSPRMADFARWATAAEPALGLQPGDFLRAYERNRASAHQLALEGHPLVAGLEELLSERGHPFFFGPATALLGMLEHATQDQKELRRDSHWPKSARALGSMLRRLAPALRSVGIDVRFNRGDTAARTRAISIRRQTS
jgi:hypothetical protein